MDPTRLVFAIDRGGIDRRQRHFAAVYFEGERGDRWKMIKLAPGVWDVPSSIHVSGQFHGFVTLLGVPHPAPWEAREDER